MAVPVSEQLAKLAGTIIGQMKEGAAQWFMPWHNGIQEPVNTVTGKVFRGRNAAILWNAFNERGYARNEWATLKQWASRRGKVRRGAKGVRVFVPVHSPGPNSVNGTTDELAGFRRYYVFNVDDINNFNPDHPDLFAEITSSVEDDDHIDQLVGRSNADVRYGGHRACYLPAQDLVSMPPREAFVATPHTTASEGFYATLVHELIHWTNQTSRSPRPGLFDDRDQAYAFEELVAELGAAIICSRFGQKVEPRPDHAAYLKGWLTVLENDFRYFYRALDQAQLAVHWLYRKTNMVPDGWSLEPAAEPCTAGVCEEVANNPPPVCQPESRPEPSVKTVVTQPAIFAIAAYNWSIEGGPLSGFVRTARVQVECGDCRRSYQLVLARGENTSACPGCYRINSHPIQW